MKQKWALPAGITCFVGILILQAAQPPHIGPATEKRFPPLKVPPGFKATLFACDPLIEYPSVISIGPKPGSIFVAVDYMTGLGTDGKVKSEVRLVEDTDGDGYADKATVFAKGFNSIQGLAYHDGTVYVMHAPFLTALRDTKKSGVADERKDLLSGLGLTPEQNPVRLHCANGVVVGHDGWLYLAMGDNGVNVLRPEGDRLIHHGGAILRCRPDGRDLHVFSSGLRNIYDIALDAEMNVFTRDNENDGGTYMIRVCHSFHGADHGYPYLYTDRPDEAMKPIGDFGLGSSAGGVCYLERQFPPEYRGNLFFCEWGKSLVRYDLKRAGAGFAPVKEIEFAVSDPKDTYPFKPTDVIIQRDGTMMVSDYADGQRPKRGRGRIYHIAYIGKKTGPDSYATKLDSESYYERWEAQSAIERGEKLPDVLGPQGRMHAIWARARIDGPKATEELLRIANSNDLPAIRAQAIRAIADLADPVLVQHKLDAGRGDVKLAKQLAKVSQRTPQVRLEVMVALGRLRWAGAPDWLRANPIQPDDAAGHAAMQMLRRADNWPAVLKLLDEPSSGASRPIALRALAERFEPVVVDDLIRRLEAEKDSGRPREYADLLTRVYKKPGPWKYWGYRPGPKPANTETWDRTEAIEKALGRWLGDKSQPHADRIAILKRMHREKAPVQLATLSDWLKTDHQHDSAQAVIAGLSEYPAAEVRQPLDAVVRDPGHSPENRKTALTMLLKEKGADAQAIVTNYAVALEDGAALADVLLRLAAYPKAAGVVASRLKSAVVLVRAAALATLGEMRAPEGRAAVLQMLQDKDTRVRRAAASAAGKLAMKEAIEPLLKQLTDADPELRLACLDSLRRLREPRALPFAVQALNERDLGPTALEFIVELGGRDEARAVVEYARRSPSAEALTLAVRGLTRWQTASSRAELARAIADLHGVGGIPVRWEISPALPSDEPEKIIAQFGRTGMPVAWSSLFASGAEARLAPPKDPHMGIRFAFTDIAVPAAAPVEFLASSHGGLGVWLNGKPIHRGSQPAKFQVDSDRFAGTLEAGVNRILVETGGDEFHLRFRRKSPKAVHEKLTQAALTRGGNAERGRKLFFDKEKSQCMKCHQIGTQGERIGPELTGVGKRFSRIYLVESILEPSRTIAPSFGALSVTLKNGKTLIGVKVAETETALTLADNQGQKHLVAKADIDEQNPSPVSGMPEGLEQRFTEDEFVDLIAFLMSQKEGRHER